LGRSWFSAFVFICLGLLPELSVQASIFMFGAVGVFLGLAVDFDCIYKFVKYDTTNSQSGESPLHNRSPVTAPVRLYFVKNF